MGLMTVAQMLLSLPHEGLAAEGASISACCCEMRVILLGKI